MAQGAVSSAPTNGASLTAEELREILEYERIVQFRDAVLSGTHPRIKIPPHLAGKQISSTFKVSSPSLPTPRANHSTQPARSLSGTHYEDSSSSYNQSPHNQRSASGYIPLGTKSEINPILLEKSDDLIKAEIQLQRQRIERSLRDQIEQQRIATKAAHQTSESLPNFDISEVLSKALSIVHPSPIAEVEPSVGARSSASDSFDENTFYSSQHETPEPSNSPEIPGERDERQQDNSVLVDQHHAKINTVESQTGNGDTVMTDTSLPKSNLLAAQSNSKSQHLPLQPQTGPANIHEKHSEMEKSNSSSSGEVHTEESSADRTLRRDGQVSISQDNFTATSLFTKSHDPMTDSINKQNANQTHLRQAFENMTASPLIRAHNLSPIAPQPARVSPLATARDPPILRDTARIDEVQPQQVAALRNKPSGISSTDSSPKGVKGSDKKKDKKKKKRKAKEVGDTPDSPYIKPEPKSPSPYTVAPLPRPQKRQRHSGQYAAELNYDEPRYEVEAETQERVPEQYKESRVLPAYDRFEERYDPETRRPQAPYRRIERDGEEEYRRVGAVQYARRPQSPAVFAVPYASNEVRSVRASSHAIVERRVHDEPEPRYYREPVRASVRPDADRERSRSPLMRERRSPIPIGPPRQSVRIVMDEYGRKYYEPAPSMRHSMAPPTRYRDTEVVYERAPMRTVSSRVPAEVYEDEGVIYRQPASPIAVPRRVVTQPEYAIAPPPEYRSYRQREYSARPTTMAPPGEEYIQIRGPPERRQVSHLEDAPREYIQRASSTRPEPVRYEIPREFAGRLQSVRPEQPPPREYAASVRPEVRRELPPQSQREFSARPVETVPRREHVTVGESDRYYEEAQSRRPAEVAFIERPRARESSVLVYADDVRREVYR